MFEKYNDPEEKLTEEEKEEIEAEIQFCEDSKLFEGR